MAKRKERIGFIFEFKWLDSIEKRSDEERLKIYEAIVYYGCRGELRKIPKAAEMAFDIIKSTLDARKVDYDQKCEKNQKVAKEYQEKMKDLRANVNERSQSLRVGTDKTRLDKTRLNKENINIKERKDTNVSSCVCKAEKKKSYVNPLEVEEIDPIDEHFIKFRAWQKEKTPNILKLQYTNLITENEFWTLVLKIDPSRVDIDAAIEKIKNMVFQIENRKDLRKRYTNLYLTTLNWLKRNGEIKDEKISVEDLQK
ncbi:MAG: DUF6291 domain-containing protein [Prevotella sp.]|nr:DUF6291 domain-containing protein [Prevotella sp.]